MMTTTSAMPRFDALCRLVAARGSGLSLAEIADAWALAEEETAGRPDSDRATTCRARLGLDAEAASRTPDSEPLTLDLEAP
jgi:hypothetical protein